jgi:hypothetical protein
VASGQLTGVPALAVGGGASASSISSAPGDGVGAAAPASHPIATAPTAASVSSVGSVGAVAAVGTTLSYNRDSPLAAAGGKVTAVPLTQNVEAVMREVQAEMQQHGGTLRSDV